MQEKFVAAVKESVGSTFTSSDEPSFAKWGDAARARFLKSVFVKDAGMPLG